MNEKICILIQITLKIVPKGPIGSGIGLAPKGRQAITWTNQYYRYPSPAQDIYEIPWGVGGVG